MKRSSWKPLLLLVLSPFVWLFELVLDPGGLPFFRMADYSDVLISHLPVSVFVHQAVKQWGQIPLWNPLILSGAPLAADPLAGFWYPPQWLAYAFPSSLTFQFLFAVHLAWAAVGSYLFLRREGLGDAGALLGALAFSGTPKFAAHIGLGHVGLVSAVSWTPWALLLIDKAMRAGERTRSRSAQAALAGACLGMVFLADPRWSFPAGIMAVLYALHLGARGKPRSAPRNWLPQRTIFAVVAITAFFAFFLSACLSLPLLEFIQQSTRIDMASSQRSVYALPAAQVLGFILPLVGHPEWVIYLGLPTVLLALVAMFSKVKGAFFWAGAGLSAVILALGDQTPLYPLMSKIVPGLSLLRVPARFIFLTSLCNAVLAGKGMDELLRTAGTTRISRRIKLFTLGLVAAAIVGTIYLSHGLDAIPFWLAAPAILLSAAAGLLIFLSVRGGARRAGLAGAWALVVVLDLVVVNAWLLEVRRVETSDTDRSVIAEQLAGAAGAERVFSPSYSIPQDISARAGLQLADGVNPLQLRRYWGFMSLAVGFDREAYSVTLPPFPSGDPHLRQALELDLEKLGQVNVRYIVSDYPLAEPALTLVNRRAGISVYRNPAFKPRAWVELEDPTAAAAGAKVDTLLWSANMIRVRAQGPGRLVLSEVSYPGWTAEVDGSRVELKTAHGLFRAVELEAGRHEIVFRFRPLLWLIGAGISLLALVAIGGLWLRR